MIIIIVIIAISITIIIIINIFTIIIDKAAKWQNSWCSAQFAYIHFVPPFFSDFLFHRR